MTILVSREAEDDLAVAYLFYEKQAAGLGSYFADPLFSNIDSPLIYAGTHKVVYNSYRCLSRRFPFSIYYRLEHDVVRVRAILDCRSKPSRVRKKLQTTDEP